MIHLLEPNFIGGGEVKGFIFERIEQTDTAYLYKVNAEGIVYYEVFKRKKAGLMLDFAKRIYSETDFKEIYPRASRFGIEAWTYRSFGKAHEKMKTL